MRILFTLITIILLKLSTPVNVVAQVQHVLYYDANMALIVDNKTAVHAELIERENDQTVGGTISLYKISPDTATYILISKAAYSSVFPPRKLHGQMIKYKLNGKRHSIQTYQDGMLDGFDIEWHDNDSIRHSIGYKQGKYDGELKTFYMSGKLKREELYQNGKQEYGKCYAEDGKEVAFVPYREMPLFPGGEGAMLRYLSQNIRYPVSSLRNKISGVVVLSFVVKKDGSIEDLRVVKSINDDLNNEAIRVVKKMPAWKPGKLEGEAVDVRYNLPITYTIM